MNTKQPISAFPLQWPIGWSRTTRRKRAGYRIGFVASRDHLVSQLRLLGARGVVVSSNIPTRIDGLPLAGGRLQSNDPGVAIYWEQSGKPRAMACDKWDKVEHNIRALGLSVEAIRALERGGTSEILDRVFTGFAQLPADGSASSDGYWRDVFNVKDVGSVQSQVEAVAAAHRELAFELHPDRGGSEAGLRRINVLRDIALAELGRVK